MRAKVKGTGHGPALLIPSSQKVRRALTNSLLSLVLLTTLVWGGCVSCENYFMWPGVKSCCAADGHCKTKAPAQKDAGRDCKQIAFDHQTSVDLEVDLTLVGAVGIVLAPATVDPAVTWQSSAAVEPSPPDLQILHSTFLI